MFISDGEMLLKKYSSYRYDFTFCTGVTHGKNVGIWGYRAATFLKSAATILKPAATFPKPESFLWVWSLLGLHIPSHPDTFSMYG